jgi:hypothetical protein
MTHESYIIAVKREMRDSVPADWRERLREIEGLQEVGGSDRRVQVEASEAAIAEVKARLASWCHIEKMIPHQRL